MVYDWTGERTRRNKRIRFAAALAATAVILCLPAIYAVVLLI